ncbi:MAG: flagellar basal body rod protein FlgB, partial [Lachnospiraceae bacterium]|nr:flagellar basal body rod protein FlgB [Lachnospiraceae bacterium]
LAEKMLDYLWTRQSVTLNNIANDDTQGFKSQYVTFEEELKERLTESSAAPRAPRRAVAEAIDSTKLRLHTTRSETTRLDGNNVDMDQEQVQLVRSAYEYQYMVNSINNDFNRLKSAARTF